jgi:hypothetical protein
MRTRWWPRTKQIQISANYRIFGIWLSPISHGHKIWVWQKISGITSTTLWRLHILANAMIYIPPTTTSLSLTCYFHARNAFIVSLRVSWSLYWDALVLSNAFLLPCLSYVGMCVWKRTRNRSCWADNSLIQNCERAVLARLTQCKKIGCFPQRRINIGRQEKRFTNFRTTALSLLLSFSRCSCHAMAGSLSSCTVA